MIRAENNRHIVILQNLQLPRQILDSQHQVLIFFSPGNNCIRCIKISFRRLVGGFLPIYRLPELIRCKILRNGDMPAGSCNPAAVIHPIDHPGSCAILPAVERVIVHQVEAADRRIFAG
ncbi:hypothetical protein D3C73_977070 [compost metagenome]